MSAQDNLSKELFHGSSADLNPGDLIEPRWNAAPERVIGDIYRKRKLAFATNSKEEAQKYADSRSQEKGMLFGNVYEVEPVEDDKSSYSFETKSNWEKEKPINITASEKGFRVIGKA